MRDRIRFISVALLLLMSRGATAGIPRTEVEASVGKILSSAPLSSSVVGVLAVTMDGDTLVAVNPRQKMVPASNVKLITTGLALNVLGEDFRFETRIGYSGEVRDGVLHGDLYIIGGGDPTTGARVTCAEPVETLFSGWRKMVTDAGIRAVDGYVIGDPRFFDSPTPENLGWTYDDLGTNYGAGPLGLNFFENAQNFLITPGSAPGMAPGIEAKYPETPWMAFSNKASTGSPRSANTVYYINTPLAPYGEFAGSFPSDRRGYTLEGSNRFGAYTCAYYFCNYLKSNGISVRDGAADINAQGFIRSEPGFYDTGRKAASVSSINVIGSSFSSRLSEIVRETNCESDNFFAETLLRMIGRKMSSTCKSDICVRSAETALRNLGLRVEGACQLFDGSGLSRKNYISADFFVSFLRAISESSVFGSYFASLPVPGGKGTLEFKFPNASAAFRNRIHMKSGSMNGVRCYSGYILSEDADPSRTVVFSLLVNNSTASSWMMNPLIDGIIESIAAGN